MFFALFCFVVFVLFCRSKKANEQTNKQKATKEKYMFEKFWGVNKTSVLYTSC